MEMVLLLNAFVDGLGDFIGELLIGLALGALELGRRIYKNSRRISALEDETEIQQDPTRLDAHERSMAENERHIRELKQYFTGDPDDPSQPGILKDIHDIKKALDKDD